MTCPAVSTAELKSRPLNFRLSFFYRASKFETFDESTKLKYMFHFTEFEKIRYRYLGLAISHIW